RGRRFRLLHRPVQGADPETRRPGQRPRRTPFRPRRRGDLMTTLSRRRLLTGAGVGIAAGAGAAVGAGLARQGVPERAHAAASGLIPFHGPHQAGIATPVQDHLHFAAFDLLTEDRAAVVAMLKAWTAAAERMTAGREV